MDGSTFEDFCRKKGLRPSKKIEDTHATIYIAETDLELDRPFEYPWGYYQTVWAISGKASKGKLDMAQWLEFESMHDKEQSLSVEGKRQARINATIKVARSVIDKCLETGRYG